MTAPYWGCTTWHVQPGREDEFVDSWSAIVRWTIEAFPGNGPGRLVQDPDESTRFLSMFAWTSLEEVAAWKAHPEFQRLWAAMEETLTGHDRQTYHLRVELKDESASRR